MLPFCRLAPDGSHAPVLRRDCRSGADLGVVVERPVLLDSLALWLAVNGTKKRADTQVRPYRLEQDAGQNARAAPAERGEQSIRDLPEVSSRPLHAGRGYFKCPKFGVWR